MASESTSSPAATKVKRQTSVRRSPGRTKPEQPTAERPSAEQLDHLLTESLKQASRDHLPFLKTSPRDFRTHADLASAYAKSYSALSQQHASTQAWLVGLLRENITCSGIKPADEARALGELTGRVETAKQAAALPMLPLSEKLTAEIGAEEVFVAHDVLVQELRRLSGWLAASIVQVLQRLHAQEYVGEIRWVADDACSFTSHTTELIHRGESTTVTEKTSSGPRRSTTGGEKWTETTTQTETRVSHNTLRQAKREQHLVGAQRHDVRDAELAPPLRLAGKLFGAPEWLRGIVEVVAGTRIREISVAQDQDTDWTESTVISRRSSERFRPIFREPVFDPAVTLGRFCLASWGDEEQHAEAARQALPWFVLAAAAVSLLAPILVVRSGLDGGLGLAASAAAWLLGGLLAFEALRCFARSGQAWRSARMLWMSVAVAACGSAGLQGAMLTLASGERTPWAGMMVIVGLVIVASATWIWLRLFLSQRRGVRWTSGERGTGYAWACLTETL